VVETGRFGEERFGALVELLVSELKKRKRATIGKREEGMTVVDFALDVGIENALAPRCDQRHAEDVLEEVAIDLLVAHDEGMMVQPERQTLQQGRIRMAAHGLASYPAIFDAAAPDSKENGGRVVPVPWPSHRRFEMALNGICLLLVAHR
jgi:hypothetical protein